MWVKTNNKHEKWKRFTQKHITSTFGIYIGWYTDQRERARAHACVNVLNELRDAYAELYFCCCRRFAFVGNSESQVSSKEVQKI